MTAAHLALAEVMAARLCHDFAGLAGTIAGMLELAEEAGQRDALPLAREAAEALTSRLRLARAAYGEPARWDETAWPRLASELGSDRVHVCFDETALQRGQTAVIGRLLLNLVLLGRSVLRERGDILVGAGAAGADLVITLVGVGPEGVRWPEMTGQSDDPARFQWTWTALTAVAGGIRLRVEGTRLHVAPT